MAFRPTHGDPVKAARVEGAPEGVDDTAPTAGRPPRPGPTIPFNRPFIAGRELFYISQAVLNGNLAGDGKFTRHCSEWLEQTFGARKVLLTHSCTAALEMSAILANVGPGDEVIMPSYTFVSTANAFALRGAELRFVDIREDTLNIDETRIEEAITERTKAVVPVHYAGVGAEMDVIMEITGRHELLVIEDAAQGVCATYKDRYLGTLGHLGTYSFHETKNLISGEGGAIVINDEEFVERAEIIRDKGTNRSKFFRGEVDKYTWVDVGSSYLASELVAAFLFAQLEESERIAAKRRATFSYYEAGFHSLQEQGLLRTPMCPPECRHNGHMFYILLESSRTRDALIDHLRDSGIHAVFHYVPLHSSPMGRTVGHSDGDLPVTESISTRMLRLPAYFELERSDQDRVIDAIRSFFKVG
jgi:dTDP-4-amino-4,6-dideoxygalactose transaminase